MLLGPSGYVKKVSRYLLLTAVNWLWYGSNNNSAYTVFLIAKIGSLFMSGCKAGLQQGDQGQQFCHYVSFLSGSQWSLACVTCPRCYLTRISNICKAARISLFWALKQTKWITRNAFRNLLQPDWRIDSGFFNRPIMACNQILVHWWVSPEQGFW